MGSNPECNFNCKRTRRKKYFCGNDGRTYNTECEQRKAKCSDPMLTTRPGKCDGMYVTTTRHVVASQLGGDRLFFCCDDLIKSKVRVEGIVVSFSFSIPVTSRSRLFCGTGLYATGSCCVDPIDRSGLKPVISCGKLKAGSIDARVGDNPVVFKRCHLILKTNFYLPIIRK